MINKYICAFLAAFMPLTLSAQITTWDQLYTAMQNGGTITLTKDISYSGSQGALVVPSGKTVTLDLNGYKIDRQLMSATKKGSVIQVKGTLIINDSKGGGIITGGYVDREKDKYDGGGGLYIYSGGKVTLNSGSIYGNKSYGKGPGVCICPGAEMTMNGGSISYNVNTKLDSAGGVYVQGSSSGGGAVFTMYDGEISHNIGGHGGGVYVDGENSASKAVFYLHGGMICYNEANGWGGGVCARSDGYFYMYGGYVFNNHAYTDGKYAGIGGGIFLEGGAHVDIEISAGTKMGIYENTAEVEGDDIESDSGATLNLISPEQMTRADGEIYFGGKAKWITDVEGKRFRDGKGSVASPQSGKITNGACLAISIPCPWCDLQDQIDNAPNNVSTTITLAGDITANLSEHFHLGSHKDRDIRLLVPANKIIVLDLNGHTLDRNLAGKTAMECGNVFMINGSLTIKDSSMGQTGLITGGNSLSDGGAILDDGTFVLESGIISGNSSVGVGGGVCIKQGATAEMKGGRISKNCTTGESAGGGVCNKGAFTLRGGEISGNSISASEYGGGGVYNDSGSTFTMNGGTIKKNTSDLGGAIQNFGTFNMTNGTICENTAHMNGNGIFQIGTMLLSGSPSFGKDQDVYLPSVENPTDVTRSTYVITKAGEIGSVTIPVKVANEVSGRDILVSRKGATEGEDVKVVEADLAKISVKQSVEELIVIFNPEGRDGGLDPKEVIEFGTLQGLIIRRSGLNDGENAIYSVYYSTDGTAYTPAFRVSMNKEDNTPAGKDYAERTIKVSETGYYKVVEESWTWAYSPDDEPSVSPAEISVSHGNNWASAQLGYSQTAVYTFTGAAKEEVSKHDEAVKVNTFKRTGEIKGAPETYNGVLL